MRLIWPKSCLTSLSLSLAHRTRMEDEGFCTAGLRELIGVLVGCAKDKDKLVRQLFGHINLITKEALDRYGDSVDRPELKDNAEHVGLNIRGAIQKGQCERWVDALVERWATIFASS